MELLVEKLLSYFPEDVIKSLGKSTRFVQRSTSRLDAMSFLLMNVLDSNLSVERSLNEYCDWLESERNIVISKQGLDERFNTYAVSFLRACFHRVLTLTNKDLLDRLTVDCFTGIYLTDSTSFKLPDQLSTFYKGFNGDGGESMVKLHFNYNLLNGHVIDISIGDGFKNDNMYEFGQSEVIQKGGLYLRDLGYFSADYFNNIDQSGAYYLSRSKSNTAYFHKTAKGYERVHIESLLPEVGKSKDYQGIYIGEKKLKVRLIIESVPEEVAEKRLAALDRYAVRQKKTKVSTQRRNLCYFNVFITNIDTDKLPLDLVRLIYSLRWQVEILFKIWKSHYNINKVGKMNIFRFECYLYSTLISVLLDHSIQNMVAEQFWQDDDEFELSPIKASKLIKKT